MAIKQLKHPSGSVEHMGDNLTGGAGDVEQIHIDLGRVPADVAKIDFTATIHDALNRRHQIPIETAVVVGEIYRHRGNWKFNAIGAGATVNRPDKIVMKKWQQIDLVKPADDRSEIIFEFNCSDRSELYCLYEQQTINDFIVTPIKTVGIMPDGDELGFDYH